MDNNLTDDDVRRIAERAKLGFDADGLAAMTKHLRKQTKIFELFDTVNTDEIPPMCFAVDIHNATRADEVLPSFSSERILACAPETDSGFFTVPRSAE